MTNLLIQEIERKFKKSKLPQVTAGSIVKIHQKIKEGEKERIQIFEGLIIAINHGHGSSKTITVRKIIKGIGVEKIFPLNSPTIAKIEIIRVGKVRQGKLYYMRGIQGKAARLKEKMGAKKRILLNLIEADEIEKAQQEKENAAIIKASVEKNTETVLEEKTVVEEKSEQIPEEIKTEN